MIPILYEKDEIDFTSQGLGSLVEIYDVDVEEQRNGLLQLTASYPVSGVRYADISVGRVILAKPNQRDDVHAFRIVSTELDISGYAVTVEADSITYDLTHNLVKHLVVSGNGQSFMTALKNAVVNPSIFAFYSDIATSSTTSLNYVNPMEAIMGTTGSFLQIWGGELKRENRRVAMFNRRGRDNVATFRLGKNISGLKYSVDISSLVTRIIPTKSVQNDDQTTTTLEGTPVDSQYINNYEQIYTLPLEFTDDTIKTVADLNAAAKGWFTKSANTGRDKPTVTIDIDVLSLQDSADYQDKFKNLESVSLTDTVTVYVPEYGVNVTAIVNELHYDPILDRVTKMTVGTAKQSFADSSRTQLSDLQDKIISVQNQTDAVAVSANGKSTNYYGSVEPSHPQKGDTWFWVNGDKSGIKVFVNGEWVYQVDSDTQEKIAAAVTDAVAQAKSHTDEVKQSLSSDIDTAKSRAVEAANAAEANAKSEATSLFNQAQNALSDAKTDLTKSISSEASKAVAAANSQAQTYANQAKADALNTIAKEVTDRQNAVSALDTKATNAVNQAKSDINDTINALSVGGRNYILNSSGMNASDTNRPAMQSSGRGSANYGSTIAYNSDSITLTYTGTGTQEWYYALAETSQKFSDTNIDKTKQHTISVDVKGTAPAVVFRGNNILSKSFSINNTDWTRIVFTFNFTDSDGKFWLRINPASTNGINGPFTTGQTLSFRNFKLEIGNKSTDWTPAPEDVVLDYTTKDNKIKETITQYKETNDGLVSKAQTDATQALGLVATKVSQTDYDTKTGDLTTKYTQVKQTTDSQATDIVDIKKTATSQASKINSISSDVDGTKQSISDIETTQDSQSDKINQITSDVNGTKQSITDIQTKDGKQDTRMGTIETSVSGVKSDFSTYKTDANGRIGTAQTTAQTAVDGLKNKVSQTDYNTKTGQLQTDLTTTTQTANQAKTDIVSIKQTDTSQDSRMNTIESDASGTKQTVSDLQTAQGKQSGSISTLQQRADGFDATVSEIQTSVNSLGQINQLFNTEFSPDFAGWINGNYAPFVVDGSYNGSNRIRNTATVAGNRLYSELISVQGVSVVSTSVYNDSWSIVRGYDQNKKLIGELKSNCVSGQQKLNVMNGISIPSTVYYIDFGAQSGVNSYISQPMLVFASTVGTYVQGTYNNNAATAKAQLTADNASVAVSKLTSADGIITKAQADIKANAEAITEKVSQTDYDDYKSKLNTRFTKVEQTADGASTTVGKLQTAFNGMSYENRNLLENSGFEFPVNNITGTFSVVDGSNTTRPTPFDTKMGLIDNVSNQVANDLYGWYPLNTAVTLKANVTYTLSYYFSVAGKAGYQHSDYGIDDSGSAITGIMAEHETPDTTGGQMVWKRYSKTFTLKTDKVLAGLRFGFVSNGDGRGWKVVDNVKLEIGSKATDYSVAPNDTTLSISQVSQKADSISNFVRDSSGNISSNFQTALSKTSIITGSTLATSIQTQTSSQISSAITNNNGKIISLINQDSSGVQIAGKNIVLDGDTTVTGDFYAKGGNFKNLNASNLTVGTLNGNQVNITNINANNIVSGAISGANLNINLNTGQVQFQKGRIFKSDYTTDINIDQGYISTANDNTRALIKQGMIQLVAPNRFDLDSSPYMELSNNRGVGTAGAAIIGRDSVSIANSKNAKNIFPAPIGEETFSGLYTGQASDGGWLPTKVSGADRGVVVAGGTKTTWQVVNSSPYIRVGTDASGSYSYGNRVAIQAEFLHATAVYYQSGSGGANVYVASDGALVKSSSATKYKTNIEHETDSIQGDQLLTIDPATWNDKFESEQLERYHEIGVEPERQINMEGKRYYGIIAEDLVKAGLEELVTRNEETNEVEGVEYSKIGVALIPIVRDLRNKLNEQAVEIERLKDKNK